ncbi:MAG: AraC family transcriptional regulator [Puniceicoccaceae bacterium]|nr:MAG: AraC family transcriptional regulator [Puniceicoccaceae bacterium]
MLYWLILRPAPVRGRTFLNLPRKQAAALTRALRGLPSRHFAGEWRLQRHLDAVTALYRRREGALAALQLGHHLTAFLLACLEAAHRRVDRPAVNPLRPVLAHIERHLGDPLPVPDLAERAGLSVSRFQALFRVATGLPPGEYVLRRRIERAGELLVCTDRSITAIAFSLGFASSQYFATAFRRYTGRSPREHRREKSAGG